MGSRVVNLFMVYSPLHCLCAELIVKHFESEARNIVFYIRPTLKGYLNPELWTDIEYHPWPRFDPEPGVFGRIRRTKSNLEMAAGYCHGADQIRLHATVIDTESINYHINYLRKRFPAADFRVRLFPDGTMNLRRHPQGIVHENLKRFRAVRRLLDSELHYYRFRGDRTGADDRIVDRIYTLPGFPHEYDTGKVVELPPFVQGRSVQKSDEVLKRALVIGQPLVVYGGMSRKGVKQVTQAIYEYLRAHGIEEIHYKSHPRDKKREYALDAYRELIIEEPLEQHLAHCAYGIVIGVCSTALLTSRMVLPEWCDVVSCGMNLMLFKNKQERLRYLKIFNQLSVKAIDA